MTESLRCCWQAGSWPRTCLRGGGLHICCRCSDVCSDLGWLGLLRLRRFLQQIWFKFKSCVQKWQSPIPHPMAKRCSRCLPLVVATILLWPCALIRSPTNSAWRNRVAIRRGHAVRLAQEAIGLLVPSVRPLTIFGKLVAGDQ